MVKQSPLQQDLFDFKYIEDQVATIKESLDESPNTKEEKDITKFFDEHLQLLRDIHNVLSEIDHNTKKKKKWFN